MWEGKGKGVKKIIIIDGVRGDESELSQPCFEKCSFTFHPPLKPRKPVTSSTQFTLPSTPHPVASSPPSAAPSPHPYSPHHSGYSHYSPPPPPLPPSHSPPPPPLLRQPILRHPRFPPQTREHDIIIRRRRIQHLQFPRREDPGKHLPPQRDQRDDEDGKADPRDGLGDPHRGGDAEHLEEEVEADAGFAELAQGFRGLHEARFFEEVDEFRGDAVGFETAPLVRMMESARIGVKWEGVKRAGNGQRDDRTYAHHEEDAGEEGAGDQVQHHQEGSGHGADDHQAHQEMGDALLDHFLGDDVLLVVFLAVVGFDDLELAAVDGQGVGVHWCLQVSVRINDNK